MVQRKRNRFAISERLKDSLVLLFAPKWKRDVIVSALWRETEEGIEIEEFLCEHFPDVFPTESSTEFDVKQVKKVPMADDVPVMMFQDAIHINRRIWEITPDSQPDYSQEIEMPINHAFVGECGLTVPVDRSHIEVWLFDIKETKIYSAYLARSKRKNEEHRDYIEPVQGAGFNTRTNSIILRIFIESCNWNSDGTMHNAILVIDSYKRGNMP